MARIKIPRKSTAIDMTAMCDVAFLLLTFFILTAKLKQEDPLRVDVPASSTKLNVPDLDMATITVGKGKVFFSLEGTDLRKGLLEEMGKKYNQSFTPEEIAKFSLIPTFGVPISGMKQYIAMTQEQRKAFVQPGLPIDTTANCELFHWIREARIVDKNLHNKELRFSIKGDSREDYPNVQKVIDVLQKQAVNKFSLITSLNSK